MSNPRFYCPTLLRPGANVRLPDNAAQHASRALRLQSGDIVTLFNGDGFDYRCTLNLVVKSGVEARVLSSHENLVESGLRITLAQAISAGDRMDFTIQKAVEMGVSAIQPIASQRSVVKLSCERADKRREHWQNVAISACEQSGRAVVPQVAAPLNLANWLAQAPGCSTRLTLSPTAQLGLGDIPKPTDGEIYLLIGAEGGLTENEIDLAASQGFVAVRLGKRVLRTETASLAALAAMQTLWGDFLSS